MAGDSVWYNALGHMDYMDDLAVIKRIKMSKKVDAQGVPLIDNKSLPEEMRSKSGLVHGGHLLGLAIGAIKQLNAKVKFLKNSYRKTGGERLSYWKFCSVPFSPMWSLSLSH